MSKELIDAYVIENEQRLKFLCKRIYGGKGDWEDLFQEFYLEVIETKKTVFDRYNLKQLCYWTIIRTYKNRQRKPALKQMRFEPINESMAIEDIPYIKDIEEYIDAQLNKAHGFASMLVFMQSLEEPLRSIERKTGINIFALSTYKRQAQKELQRLCM